MKVKIAGKTTHALPKVVFIHVAYELARNAFDINTHNQHGSSATTKLLCEKAALNEPQTNQVLGESKSLYDSGQRVGSFAEDNEAARRDASPSARTGSARLNNVSYAYNVANMCHKFCGADVAAV